MGLLYIPFRLSQVNFVISRANVVDVAPTKLIKFGKSLLWVLEQIIDLDDLCF